MQHYKLDINVKGRIVSEAKLLESVEICAAKPDSPLRDLLGSILGRQQPFLLNKHKEVALSGNLERNGCLFKEIKVPTLRDFFLMAFCTSWSSFSSLLIRLSGPKTL